MVWRRRSIVILLAAALAVAGSVVGGDPVADAGRAQDAGNPCGDLQLVTVVDGQPLCTHGPDQPTPPSPTPESGVQPEATPGIQCYGDGTSGPRVELIYAHPPTLDRFATFYPVILQRAGQIDAIYNASAQQTGGQRYVRWVTDGQCNLVVRNVTVSQTAIPSSGFSTLTSELANQGYDSSERKYLVWVDTNNTNPGSSCSGLGTMAPDDRPGQENRNNNIVGYTRVDEVCLRDAFTGRVEAHELMHTLGAVQSTAPNASSRGHCRDEYDVMCYDDDGTGPFTTTVVCTNTAQESRLDCNDNDYFHTSPPAGNYLATHWNTASSRWLESAPSAPPQPGVPSAPRGVSPSVGDQQVTLAWQGPASNGGSPILSYRVYRDGVRVGETDGMTLSFTDTGLTNERSYSYQVSAVNAAGEGARSATVTAVPTDLPPHGYNDVPPGAYYELALRWAAAEDIVIASFADGGFHPDDDLNRAQIANMLWSMMDQPAGSRPHGFSDVPRGVWYGPALNWAKAAGLVTGYSRNIDCSPYAVPCYKPKSPVLRGQLVAMLWNMVGAPAGSPPFSYTDVPDAAWYRDALEWADEHGIINEFGPNGTEAQPRRAATRAEVVFFLFNVANTAAAWENPDTAPSHVRF